MAKKLLTNKKQKWAKQYKPKSISGTQLRNSVPVQARYVRKMQALTERVIEETEKTVLALLKSGEAKEYFSNDASIASSARIDMNKLFRALTKVIKDKSVDMAKQMVLGTDKQSKSALHRSLKEMSGGLNIKTNISSPEISNALKASINTNVDLIGSINSGYMDNVKGIVNRAIQGGGSLDEIMPAIQKSLSNEARKVRNKAKNVALDQTRKAYNSLNKARMEKVGVKKFQWIHTGASQEPREHHQKMFPDGLNRGIYSFDDLPVIDEKTGERGIPGQAINCKCVMKPVIEFDEGEPDAKE